MWAARGAMVDMENTQDALPGMGEPPAQEVEVARVLVDVDLPHLDHPLDYMVPEALAATAQVGCSVQVRLGGRKQRGWILERAREVPRGLTLQSVESVTSRTPVLTPALVALARTIADKHVATMSQALSLALPARHATTEKAVLAESDPVVLPVPAPDDTAWRGFPAGAALLAHLGQGENPRAVWTSVPPVRDAQMVSLVQACLASGRTAVVVVATDAAARAVSSMLSSALGCPITLSTGEESTGARWRAHLEGVLGRTRVLVGTRSAVWTPMSRLGLILVWDEGDDRLRERRNPRTDALEVAIARAHLEGCALVSGSWTRSVRAQALVRSGWAAPIGPDLATRRALSPVVRVQDEADMEREGPAGRMRIPRAALKLLREGLASGPVLVQVPFAGYVPVVSCTRCASVARCATCHGPLGLRADGAIACSWCDRGVEQWRCGQCHSTSLRARRVGSDRTGEELGRAFPGVPLTVSSAGHEVTRAIPDKPRIVVATAGCEPACEAGYAAGLVLEAAAVSGRGELWAPEEALRRWFNALALVRPGGSALVTGGVEQSIGQALVRWDTSDFAERALDEREALGFFPAATLVALDGAGPDVAQVAQECGGELLGTVPLPAVPGVENSRVRTILRWPKEGAASGLATLRRIQQSRSSRRLPQVRLTVNPPELF